MKPQSNWKLYAVKVLSETFDLQQAERRLQKAFYESAISTTSDCETNKNSQMPVQFSDSATQKLLRKKVILQRKTSKKQEVISSQSSPSSSEEELREQSKAKLDEKKIISSNDCNDSLNMNSDHNDLPDINDTHDEALASSNSDVTREGHSFKSDVLLARSSLGNEAINAVIGEFKTFVAQQMADVEKSVKSSVSRARRSLQFDMNKKFEEIRLMMAINCPQPSQEEQVTADLSSRMPLKTLDEFLIFDGVIGHDKTNDHFTTGSQMYENDVKKIIAQLIHPDVQILYSAAGRFLSDKYKDSKVPLKFLSVTSDFLSGAGDRNGLRAFRQ
ncbi:hypothetical protein PV325_010640 [Microctonus aethiopoides]|nr:hypothetical protein PV325_010640 [Microctonus aethiopoides]